MRGIPVLFHMSLILSTITDASVLFEDKMCPLQPSLSNNQFQKILANMSKAKHICHVVIFGWLLNISCIIYIHNETGPN